MLKREDQLTKRQYVYATTKNNPTTSSIATATDAKSIKIKILGCFEEEVELS
jgi:hypothetical protein